MSDSRYNGYHLLFSFDELSERYEHFRDKMWSASIYASGKYSLEEVSSLSLRRLSISTIYRFIKNDLKDISPEMYDKCSLVLKNHKHYGKTSMKEIRYRRYKSKKDKKEATI